MNQKLEPYFTVFGLQPDASEKEVKKAYRMKVKFNHPDRFPNEDQKMKQEIVMKELNEAYSRIMIFFNNNSSESGIDFRKNPVKNSSSGDDYTLYKKGLEYLNQCYEGISLKNLQQTDKDNKESLGQAKYFFVRVLKEYPRSDWVFDSEEKLRRIEKMMLRLNHENLNPGSPILPRKDPEFYRNKFRKLFQK